MKKSRFIEEPIALAFKQTELGAAIHEITRKLWINEQTLYRWKK